MVEGSNPSEPTKNDFMDLESSARKEIEKIDNVIKELKLVDGNGEKLLQLTKSYFNDAKYFHSKKQHLQAFEAAVICWAYIDAGLHTKVFSIPEKFLKMFTV